jgi:ribose transport system substrate-binding protein
MMNPRIFGAVVGLGASLGATAIARADDVYIPLISKGFQHQFWQAVKAGAEQAAKEANVKITFEGPETEAMVDKQIDMLSADLAKHPNAIGFAALDSKAAIPLLKKAQAANIPVIAFDSGVDSDIPLTTCTTDNLAAAASPRTRWPKRSAMRARSPSSCTIRPAAPASIVAMDS